MAVVRVEDNAYIALKHEILSRHGSLRGHLKDAVTEAVRLHAERLRDENDTQEATA